MMKTKIILILILIKSLYGFNLTFFKPFTEESIEKYGINSKIITRGSYKNLDILLDKAVMTKKISSIDKYRLHILYSKWNNGAIFLAKCLKTKGCNPYKFYKEVYNKPSLYKYIYLKYPNISHSLLMQKVGLVNEKIMDKYFKKTGWTKIEGEVGRNGVDGLYIKYDKNGNIKDVMLVEAKYNKSKINKTSDGAKQMSKEWSIKKIDKLIQKYPNNPEYKIIKQKIITGDYKARLWKMNEKDNKLNIELQKIIPDEKNIQITDLKGGEKTKINYKDNFTIDMNNPNNNFQKEIIQWYRESINEI